MLVKRFGVITFGYKCRWDGVNEGKGESDGVAASAHGRGGGCHFQCIPAPLWAPCGTALHPLPCVTAERPRPPGRKPHAPAPPIFNAYHTQQTSSPQTAHCTPFTIAMRGHTPEVGGGDEVRHDPLGDEALHMFAAIFVAPAAQLSEELH